MAGPTTYAEWVDLLDKFLKGDDNCLDLLSKGSFKIDAGTAYRFYVKIEEVYRSRKIKWLDSFQKTFDLNQARRIEDFEIALRNAKQNLIPISKFINLSGIPEDLSTTLNKDLKDFIAQIKKTLNIKVANISSSKERMLIIISSFDLPSVNSTGAKSITSDFPEMPNDSNSGRKIIF